MGETLSAPAFTFDVGEHIAFCFTCVARSLSPEQEAAIILREVFEFSNLEAATMVGVSEPVLRPSPRGEPQADGGELRGPLRARE
jgi:hypothetical protein